MTQLQEGTLKLKGPIKAHQDPAEPSVSYVTDEIAGKKYYLRIGLSGRPLAPSNLLVMHIDRSQDQQEYLKFLNLDANELNSAYPRLKAGLQRLCKNI